MTKTIRVLVAKPGLDGHDRGALVIAQALRDYGMEVIYTGLRQSPAQIIAAAIQEDVDAIGLSCLSGAHNELFPAVVEGLKEQKAEDIIVVGGGIIPAEDIKFLEEKGIQKIFTPGTPTIETARYIEQAVFTRDGIKIGAAGFEADGVNHIGIAVHSIEQALALYTDVFHFDLAGIETVKSKGVRVAFIDTGNVKFELLEPLSEDSPVAKFLDKKGEGIHHIAMNVKNIDERIRDLKGAGINMLSEKASLGAGGARVAFTHPKSTGRILFELCEKPTQEEA